MQFEFLTVPRVLIETDFICTHETVFVAGLDDRLLVIEKWFGFSKPPHRFDYLERKNGSLKSKKSFELKIPISIIGETGTRRN